MKSKKPEKGQKSLRKGRISEQGQFYFVTTCCYEKQTFFKDKINVSIIFNTLEWLQVNKYIDLHFCIAMPDHVHLVFQLIGNKPLSEVIKSFKQFTGKSIKHKNNPKNTVWQEQYYDHLIRKDESLREIIKYCLNNPVRAGIVDESKEYPYWISKYEL